MSTSARPVPVLYESMVVGEAAALALSLPWWTLAPRGRGETVLVLPGFGASDRSTRPLRAVLRGLGHRPHGWGVGTNVGPAEHVIEGLLRRFDRLAAPGHPIHLVGWSLGGVYARFLAHHRPQVVRQVITLGSPLRQPSDPTDVARLYALQARRWGFDRERRTTPMSSLPVPSTSIYTRTDAVVPWSDCLQVRAPQTQNIEVVASHIGLGVNPAALYAVADRLAGATEGWRPFRPPPVLSPCYPELGRFHPDETHPVEDDRWSS